MRGLAIILIAACVLSAMAMCAADPTVVWYRFEDGKVGDAVPCNTQVVDSGPNGLNGWAPYGCNARRVAGIAPGSTCAWDISGLADWVFVPDDPKLAIEGSLTLETWVKLRSYQNTAVSNFIVFRGDSRPGWDAYCLALNRSGDLIFHIEGPGYRQGDPQPTVECPFTWFDRPVHLAGVFNAQKGSLGLYVNGKLMDSMTTGARPRVPMNPAMGPGLGVGGYHGGDQSSFAINGVIDEVRVSNAALEPSAFLCGPPGAVVWMGTRGFEQDGVEPDCGRPGSDFLFAIRCTGLCEPVSPIMLELRRNGAPLEPMAMDRAASLPDDNAAVYRARVKLDAGKWEYRVVGDLLDGAPTQWHPGPVVE